MNFMKRVNGSWVDTPNYIHKTDTDTITTLPAVVYPNGTTATVGLKGNTVQSGTPTRDNPIMPQGTGERTGNLFDPYTVVNGYYTSDTDGELKPASNYTSSDYIEVEGNTNYYITPIPSGNWGAWYDENKTYISGISFYNIKKSPVNAKYVRLTVSRDNNPDYATNFMIAKSSVSIPYEPYGYKIPISSANTTTPVYLGEVETTRRVKKLVLTGEEDWGNSVNPTLFGVIRLLDLEPFIPQVTAYCSHYIYNPIQSGLAANMVNGEFALQKSSNAFNLYIRNTDYTTHSNFKDYLRQQYANGTPVTVWYVLATEETGTVNEPLMKIGTYSDEVSNISIPVTAGGDTISVDTTVQPSEATVNYKGWHPAIVHEKSKNLFDKSKRTDNSRVVYTTGDVGALNGIFVSDFTPIEPNTTYTLNIVSGIIGKTRHLFALYDENKNFVDTGTHEATAATVYTFTTPSNVAYIRFNGNMTSVDSTMFNKGLTALPYEPFWT